MIWHPYDYQVTMSRFMRDHPKNMLLCSPGVGKTVVTLDWLNHLFCMGEAQGVLIVAPLRVTLLTWPEQIAKWDHSSWMRVANLRTKEGIEAWKSGSADVYLINPELLPNRLPEMFAKGVKCPANVLVWDELSLCKNPSSVRVKELRKHIDHFSYRTGLTGTPVPNDYMDLFGQVRLIDDGVRLGRTITQYRQAYFTQGYMKYDWKINPGAKEKIDEAISDIALVMLGEDYLDVPTTATEDIEITLPPDARKFYKTLEKELLVQMKDSEVVALSAATLANKLLQATSGAVYGENDKGERIVEHLHNEKIKALLEISKKHKGEPILVLTQYKHEMERILKAMPDARKFDEKDLPMWRAGKIKSLISDFRSLSHGIDGLQDGGRIAVWFSPTWSYEGFTQTNARLIRTGQTRNTIIYRLLAKDTIDEAVVEAVREKNDTERGLLHALKNLQKLRLTWR